MIVLLIVVDFGTSTTFDVINSKKQFIGGVIAQELKHQAQYLVEKAALLNSVPLKFPEMLLVKLQQRIYNQVLCMVL